MPPITTHDPIASASPTRSESPAARSSTRLLSLDAYRGFVMLLMASGGLGIAHIAKNFPDSSLWKFLDYHFEHVEWTGCALWDLIQPSFMFMVGVALPFSIASRRAKSDSFGKMFLHAVWRSFLLVALGIFLRSVGSKQTYFTFEDVLTQIGLGYTFLFLLGWTKPRVQVVAAIVILFFYWLAFALWPLPPENFDWAKVGVPANWPHLHGFAAHWDKNFNFAATADQWFLNLFPRENPFVFNGGGYLTLNFVPSLATMIFGLLAGNLLRGEKSPMQKLYWLLGVGIACLAVGKILDATGVCPSVKKIWTPAWVIFSTGWTCLLLAAFYALIDLRGWKRWAFPLVVVGMNSIAIYVMAHLWQSFIFSTTKTHLGQKFFEMFGVVYKPMFQSIWAVLVLWLICFWMYRRKIFLRL